MIRGQLTLLKLLPKHLHFRLTRCGWKITTISGHYTFEQKQFKNDFVIMNQLSRQNAKKKIFFKLMNNVIMIVVTMLTTVIYLQFMMNLKN